MGKLSGWLKAMTGVFAAVVAAFSTGCHAINSNETKDVYGPPPADLDDPDINPEILDNHDQNINPKQYPTPNSNEALDVYGPPPADLDDPDINPEILEEGIEPEKEAELPSNENKK